MSHTTFAKVIGHETVSEVLSRALAGGRLSHAYLLVGPEGVGKSTFARGLLAEFLETQPATLEAHPDFLSLSRLTDEKTGKEKSQISVEQIRDVTERMAMSSFSGRKAVWIEEADRLNPAAANALLKTLEEPDGQALFLLRASSLDSVMPTIASRCQIIRFHLVPRQTMADALQKRGLPRSEAEQLAATAVGRPGWALRFLQDGAWRAARETVQGQVRELMSESLPARFRRIGTLLPKEEVNKAAVLEETLEAWERLVRDRLLAAIGCADLALDAPVSEAEATGPLWVRTLSAIRESREAIRHNINPQLALEHVALSF